MLRVLKYGTGHEIPSGATFLSTVVEEKKEVVHDRVEPIGEGVSMSYGHFQPVRYVWHYFLVECDDEGNPPATREYPR